MGRIDTDLTGICREGLHCAAVFAFPGQRITNDHTKPMLRDGKIVNNEEIRMSPFDRDPFPFQCCALCHNCQVLRILRTRLSLGIFTQIICLFPALVFVQHGISSSWYFHNTELALRTKACQAKGEQFFTKNFGQYSSILLKQYDEN
jgi:hypothetical protein